MSTIITHRNTRIVTLSPDELVGACCRPGDIALVPDGSSWWTQFVGESGAVESYDEPFDNYNKALWTAKAAAEFDAQ